METIKQKTIKSTVVTYPLMVAEKIIGLKKNTLPILNVPFEDLWKVHNWLDEQRATDIKKYQENINNTKSWLPLEYKKLKNKIKKRKFQSTYEDPELSLFFNQCIFVEVNSMFAAFDNKTIN
jgi:hypothetical protein